VDLSGKQSTDEQATLGTHLFAARHDLVLELVVEVLHDRFPGAVEVSYNYLKGGQLVEIERGVVTASPRV
jgi:hypothetical protein